jgi:hypothetical protein
MTWKSWRAGLLAAAVGVLASPRANAQAVAPPGVPPSEARGGPAIGPESTGPYVRPAVCVPTVETKTVDKRVYSTSCDNVCYPNCGGLGLLRRLCSKHGCGECDDGCADGGCHKCSKVYTKKYLVLHIRKEEKCYNRCIPEPVACEAPCPAPCPAPCQAPCGAPAIVPPPGLLHGGPMR